MYALVIDPDEGFDTGTPLSWLESNVRIALRDPKLGPALAKSLPALLEKLDA
jgi:UTP--glucose-1-phosphate uridylyltransferase